MQVVEAAGQTVEKRCRLVTKIPDRVDRNCLRYDVSVYIGSLERDLIAQSRTKRTDQDTIESEGRSGVGRENQGLGARILIRTTQDMDAAENINDDARAAADMQMC